MTGLELLFYIYFILIVFLLLALIIIFILLPRESTDNRTYPNISILLAVRNEQSNIIRCLHAIEELDYPKDKLEILIGDDQSEDKTVEIILSFIADKNNYQLFHIKEKLGLAGAKGNVLAHLAKKASSDIFFITDADVKVPKSWIHGMLSNNTVNTGIISGSAIIEGEGILAKFQCLDWITAFGMIYTASNLGVPVTAVGNNMMIKKEAYLATGGFEAIPFSVTEDFDLHEATRKTGWINKNLLNISILTATLPIKGFTNIMQQRKRWMHGAVRIPWYLVAILSLQAFLFPVVMIAFFYLPRVAIGFWIFKFLLQNVFLYLILKRVKQPLKLLKYSVFYELYNSIITFVLMIYYFLPVKTNWKGRKYE